MEKIERAVDRLASGSNGFKIDLKVLKALSRQEANWQEGAEQDLLPPKLIKKIFNWYVCCCARNMAKDHSKARLTCGCFFTLRGFWAEQKHYDQMIWLFNLCICKYMHLCNCKRTNTSNGLSAHKNYLVGTILTRKKSFISVSQLNLLLYYEIQHLKASTLFTELTNLACTWHKSNTPCRRKCDDTDVRMRSGVCSSSKPWKPKQICSNT